MQKMKKHLLALAALGGVALAAASVQAAQPGVNVGSLTCNMSGSVGMIVTSQQSMNCTFNTASGRTEYYTGVIRNYGIDLGATSGGKMAWAVFAPGQVSSGALTGNYAGAGAQVTAGLGLGANVLLGGSESQIALQPVSVEASSGLNLAIGVAQLELRPMK
jgi:hypothetical protein